MQPRDVTVLSELERVVEFMDSRKYVMTWVTVASRKFMCCRYRSLLCDKQGQTIGFFYRILSFL
jgi:hypothetical protein